MVFAFAKKRLLPKGGRLARFYAGLIALGGLAWLFAIFSLLDADALLFGVLVVQPLVLIVTHGLAALKPASLWLTAALSLMTGNLGGTAGLFLYNGATPSVGQIAGLAIGGALVALIWAKAFAPAGQSPDRTPQ